MGGNKTTTATNTSGPTNPLVDSTTTQLLSNLQGQVNKGTAVFNESLNPGAGQTTQDSWAGMLGAANNPAYNAGIAGATSDFADAAAGNQYSANDPYYNQLSDTSLRDVNAMFTNSGRFGSGSHVGTAVKALGDVNNANIAADRAWQSQAAGMLPDLYSASMAPSQVQAGVGAAQDANALALQQGRNDLFRRQNDAGWSTLGQASSILAGTAGAGTQQQTSTQTVPQAPWWQSLASLGGQFL